MRPSLERRLLVVGQFAFDRIDELPCAWGEVSVDLGAERDELVVASLDRRRVLADFVSFCAGCRRADRVALCLTTTKSVAIGCIAEPIPTVRSGRCSRPFS